MDSPTPILARQESLGLTIPRAVAVVGAGGVRKLDSLFSGSRRGGRNLAL